MKNSSTVRFSLLICFHFDVLTREKVGHASYVLIGETSRVLTTSNRLFAFELRAVLLNLVFLMLTIKEMGNVLT
jgi:hypothetical protein